MRYCQSCQFWKHEDDFYESNSECKDCRKEYVAQWNDDNRERRREINRKSEAKRRAKAPDYPRTQALPIVIDGVTYPSRAAAARALGVHHREIKRLAEEEGEN